MCVTSDRNPSHHRRRSQERDRIQSTDGLIGQEENVAIDEPPAVVDLRSGQPRSLRARTPQHIATLYAENLAATTAPLLLQKRYLIQGTVDGKILVYSSEQILSRIQRRSHNRLLKEEQVHSAQRPIEPKNVIDTAPFFRSNTSEEGASAEPSPIVACSPLPEQSRKQCKMIAIDVLGHVTMLNLAGKSAQRMVYCTWKTGRPNVSSCTFTLRGCIVIGYRDGIVEGWRVIAGIDGPVPKLLWRASGGSPHPISSVCQLCPNNEKADTSSGAPMHEHIAVALENSKVYVLDTTSLEQSWRQRQTQGKETHDETLAFRDFWNLAEAGRELPPPSLAVETASTPQFHDLDNGAVLLSYENMLVTLSSKLVNDQFTWGVTGLASSGCRFPYPLIGLGYLHLERAGLSPWSEQLPYFVAALQGGSVYLIPRMTETDDSVWQRSLNQAGDGLPPIQTVMYPRDEDLDVSGSRLLQGFTAGFMEDEDSSKLPILVFAWPGGIVDAYSCRLMDCAHALTEEQLVMKNLVQNGSMDTIRKLILSSEAPDSLDESKWMLARAELQATPDQPTEDLIFCERTHPSLLQILLQLATKT